ncbi:MAG: type II asparaginase [Breznakibacter sp.]
MKKMNYCLAIILLLIVPFVYSQNPALPNVVMIATGGTIAGSGESSTMASYTSGVAGVDEMLRSVPGVEKLAEIKGEQFCKIGSQDMTFDILLRLANYLNDLLASQDVDAVVITHGTDTMEESAYFLSLTVKSDKPVVMVGAMRPSSALSAEGPLNLYNAIATAVSPKSVKRGVLVVMNDLIFDAQSLIKMNTASVQAFQAPDKGPAGKVNYGVVEYYRYPSRYYGVASDLSVAGVTKLPRVDVIYACTDMPADLIEASVKLGAKGIVVAGVGNGNLNATSLKACADAAKKGVVVVRSSRVATGSVGRNVEVNDDELGLVAADQLNPAKARVLLSLLLVKNRTPQQIQEYFFSY